MKLKVSAEYVLSPLAPLLGRAHAWVNRIHVLSDGSAVAHLSSIDDDEFRDHLVVMRDGRLRVIHEPASLTLARERCEADPDRRKGMFAQSFRVQDRVGLLLSDRWAWLFDPLHGDEAVELAIEAPLPTWAHARHENLRGAYRPQRCGETVDHRVPVSLQHPDTSHDYTGYLSLLDVDVKAARARWSLLDAQGRPVTVPYEPNPNYEGMEGYGGAQIGGLAWLGDRLRVFNTGNSTHLGRMGHGTSCAVLETGPDGQAPVALRVLDESCHGCFVNGGDDVLLEPRFKTGPRKGKPSLLALSAGTEEALAPPRGYAGFLPYAMAAGTIWFVGGSSSGSWSGWQTLSVRDDEDDHCRVIACQPA
ncbi:MAG TPA: hypothetical protein VIN03_12845 [Roseateles sp.]